MIYYIEPIYKTTSSMYELYQGNVKINSIKEEKDTLFFDAKLITMYNATLPHYALYMSVMTEFGEINNIPTLFKTTLESVSDAGRTYKSDEYSFNFSLNLNQSSLFHDAIRYSKFNFVFKTSFNQSVVRDFGVKATDDSLYCFVRDVNKSKSTIIIDYANCYDLKIGNQEINLDNFATEQNIYNTVSFNFPKMNSAAPINDLLSFFALSYAIHFWGGEIKITALDETRQTIKIPIPFKLQNGNEESTFYLRLDNFITYDQKTKTFNAQYFENMKGFYVDQNMSFQIDIDLRFQRDSLNRRIKGTQIITFKSDSNSTLNNLKTDQVNIDMITNYKEIENEKIF